MATTQQSSATSPIGRDTVRIDGPRKVTRTGAVHLRFQFPGMLYAVPVEATIANGKLLTLDTSAAEKMPNVRAVFHRANIGKIFRSTPAPGFDRVCLERRPPFEDDVIRYYGQYIALAVADTFEAAKAAADAVRATYSKEKPNVDSRLEAGNDPDVVFTGYGPVARLQSHRGDAAAAFASAPVKLDETYVTPAETHNPLELHSTTAMWDGREAHAVRLDARCGQPAKRNGANVRLAQGERARYRQVPRLWIRGQALSLDTRSARRRCSASVR